MLLRIRRLYLSLRKNYKESLNTKYIERIFFFYETGNYCISFNTIFISVLVCRHKTRIYTGTHYLQISSSGKDIRS